jgi:hypothetical protein
LCLIESFSGCALIVAGRCWRPVFDALYAPAAAREYGWTDAGKGSAARNGVTEGEVVDALYSSRRIEHRIGTLLLAVAGWPIPLV